MKAVDQRDINLIRGVKGATQPESQKPIPLTDELKQIGVDATHVAGSTFEELMSGEGRDTRDRVATPRNPISLLKERFKKLRLGHKKAA